MLCCRGETPAGGGAGSSADAAPRAGESGPIRDGVRPGVRGVGALLRRTVPGSRRGGARSRGKAPRLGGGGAGFRGEATGLRREVPRLPQPERPSRRGPGRRHCRKETQEARALRLSTQQQLNTVHGRSSPGENVLFSRSLLIFFFFFFLNFVLSSVAF